MQVLYCKYEVVLTFWSVVETLLNKELGSNFEFVGETLVGDHSNESF